MALRSIQSIAQWMGPNALMVCQLLIKAKLAQLDIEAVGSALKHNIISPEQAVAIFWDSEAIHFIGLELGGVDA